MEAIYRFYLNFGRHGDIEGRFVADPDDVANACGRRVDFYEPWGKHSSAYAILSAEMFSIVTADPADVATFKRLRLWSGENPIGWLRDNDPTYTAKADAGVPHG